MQSAMGDLDIQIVAGCDHNTLPGSKEFRDAIRAFIASANSSPGERQAVRRVMLHTISAMPTIARIAP
jgi:hypothetical protein